MPQTAVDVVFLAADWQSRTLIRAQLIEQGLEVVATDSWPVMRRHLRVGAKPRLAIVDLKDLPDPHMVLRDLGVLMKPERVLVLSSIATVPPDETERLGFHTTPRPFAIEDVVRTAAAMIRAAAEN